MDKLKVKKTLELTCYQKAHVLNLAMRLEVMGYDSLLFQKFLDKFQNCKSRIYKKNILEFLRNTSPMTQRLYLEMVMRKDLFAISGLYATSRTLCKRILTILSLGGIGFIFIMALTDYIGG